MIGMHCVMRVAHACSKKPAPFGTGLIKPMETIQCTQNGTSQIHSRQVAANTTVETAVVEAPSLT